MKRILPDCVYYVAYCTIWWRHPTTNAIKLLKGMCEYVMHNCDEPIVAIFKPTVESINDDILQKLKEKLKQFMTENKTSFRQYEKHSTSYVAFIQTELLNFLQTTLGDIKSNIRIMGGEYNVNVSHEGNVRRSIILPSEQIYSATPTFVQNHGARIYSLSHWSKRMS